jgi:Flp pilus assembly pilin Flp
MRRLLRLLKRDNAVSAIEFALLGGLVAGVIVIVIGAITVYTVLGQIYDYVKNLVVQALQ